MQITEIKVKVSDLCKNYSDNNDGGVFGLDGQLQALILDDDVTSNPGISPHLF